MTSITSKASHFERLTEQNKFMAMGAFHANASFREHPRLDKVCLEYIYANHCVARATVPLMWETVKCAEKYGNDPVCIMLIDYLKQHIKEEQDHDKWYVKDLAALGMDEATLFGRIPPPNIAAMIGSLYYWVRHHHPIAFMGYIASAEAYPPTVEFVNELITKSGLPAAGFDTLMLHARIDINHSKQIIDQVNALPLTEAHYDIMQMSSFQTFRYMSLIIQDVCRSAGTEKQDKLITPQLEEMTT
jgi:hypothetical protein